MIKIKWIHKLYWTIAPVFLISFISTMLIYGIIGQGLLFKIFNYIFLISGAVVYPILIAQLLTVNKYNLIGK